jgi:hypothetical protein
MSTPSVEKALSELIDQIVAGAKPLKTSKEVQDDFREKYRPDFDNPANQEAWVHDREKALLLGRMVGNLAAFLTDARCTLNGQPAPQEIDGECADLAGWLVSRTLCPPPNAPTFRGRHCGAYAGSRGPLLDMATDVIRQVVKATLPAPRSGPLAKA